MNKLLARFIKEEEGQDLIEYALLAALIAVALIATLGLLNVQIIAIFTRITTALTNA